VRAVISVGRMIVSGNQSRRYDY